MFHWKNPGMQKQYYTKHASSQVTNLLKDWVVFPLVASHAMLPQPFNRRLVPFSKQWLSELTGFSNDGSTVLVIKPYRQNNRLRLQDNWCSSSTYLVETGITVSTPTSKGTYHFGPLPGSPLHDVKRAALRGAKAPGSEHLVDPLNLLPWWPSWQSGPNKTNRLPPKNRE